MQRKTLAAASMAALVASPALAHTGAGAAYGFAAGFAHPLLGLDHVLAMVTVGLWAGLVGGRALWAWPAAFVALMALGAVLGREGAALPAAEAMIALSLVVLGLAAAAKARPAASLGALLCGLFALFHGHAHGLELPAGAAAESYIAGFGAATALLHGLGLSGAVALSRMDGAWLLRLAGGAVAATGLALLVI